MIETSPVTIASSIYNSNGNLDIVPLIKTGAGTDYHRILLPFTHMGLNIEEAKKKSIVEHLSTARVVTFNREPGIDWRQFIALKMKYGFRLLLDMDDWIYLYPHHMLYKAWTKNNIPQKYEELMRVVDGITTTTPRLARQLEQYNENVFIVRNAIPFDDDSTNQFLLRKERDNKEVQFGYVSGSTHRFDLATIKGIWHKFPKLHFALAGYNNPSGTTCPQGYFTEINRVRNVWDFMEKECSLNYSNPNYRRLPTKELHEYMSHYDSLDVAIAPLEANPFNSFKSSLKAYEAGAKKCAFICSDVPPYSDDLPRDIVMMCKTTREWIDVIKYCRANPSFVKEKGEALYEWVKENRNMKMSNMYREQIFDYFKS